MKFGKLLSISSALLLMFVVGCSDGMTAKNEEAVKYVDAINLQKKGIQKTDVYTGRIKSLQEVNVTSKTAGEVEAVYFNVGDKVNKGDILFKLDRRNMQNNIEALKTQIESAQAAINTAQSSYEMSKGGQKENQLNQSETALEQVKLQYEDIKKTYEDIKNLFEAGAASKQQYDQLKTAYDQAKLTYESTQKTHDLMVEKILGENEKISKNQLSQALAGKNNLLVQLKNSEDALNDLEIKSPIDGIVAQRNIDAGEIAGVGTPPFTIVNTDKVYVDIDIPSKTINQIELGQSIEILIEASGDNSYKGVITQISPIADERSFTYPVRIEIENKKGFIKSGMFAKASIELDKIDNALVVPRGALRINGNDKYAYIVENEIVKKVDVEIGIDNGYEVEIKSGLQEGQDLIIKGREYVKEGDKVSITDKEQ